MSLPCKHNEPSNDSLFTDGRETPRNPFDSCGRKIDKKDPQRLAIIAEHRKQGYSQWDQKCPYVQENQIKCKWYECSESE